MYEVFEQLLQKHGVSPYKVSKDTGVTQTSLSNWKTGKSTPTTKTLQRLADYLGVTLDYLMTGKEEPKEKSPELTARDEKDITKTLNKVMEQFENNENGPLYYDGEEIDETSRILIRNAFEYIIRETKKENKVKYNPNKNKTEK